MSSITLPFPYPPPGPGQSVMCIPTSLGISERLFFPSFQHNLKRQFIMGALPESWQIMYLCETWIDVNLLYET